MHHCAVCGPQCCLQEKRQIWVCTWVAGLKNVEGRYQFVKSQADFCALVLFDRSEDACRHWRTGQRDSWISAFCAMTWQWKLGLGCTSARNR